MAGPRKASVPDIGNGPARRRRFQGRSVPAEQGTVAVPDRRIPAGERRQLWADELHDSQPYNLAALAGKFRWLSFNSRTLFRPASTIVLTSKLPPLWMPSAPPRVWEGARKSESGFHDRGRRPDGGGSESIVVGEHFSHRSLPENPAIRGGGGVGFVWNGAFEPEGGWRPVAAPPAPSHAQQSSVLGRVIPAHPPGALLSRHPGCVSNSVMRSTICRIATIHFRPGCGRSSAASPSSTTT